MRSVIDGRRAHAAPPRLGKSAPGGRKAPAAWRRSSRMAAASAAPSSRPPSNSWSIAPPQANRARRSCCWGSSSGLGWTKRNRSRRLQRLSLSPRRWRKTRRDLLSLVRSHAAMTARDSTSKGRPLSIAATVGGLELIAQVAQLLRPIIYIEKPRLSAHPSDIRAPIGPIPFNTKKHRSHCLRRRRADRRWRSGFGSGEDRPTHEMAQQKAARRCRP
jgi:hypothetical protein